MTASPAIAGNTTRHNGDSDPDANADSPASAQTMTTATDASARKKRAGEARGRTAHSQMIAPAHNTVAVRMSAVTTRYTAMASSAIIG